jgi:hypothetical protein
MADYNFAKAALNAQRPHTYEHITRLWTPEPNQFVVNPIHLMPRLNT